MLICAGAHAHRDPLDAQPLADPLRRVQNPTRHWRHRYEMTTRRRGRTMTYLIALASAALVGGALSLYFRRLDPAQVNYQPCEGGWWEAELNGCQTGLHMIPQQPINTYTALTYLAGSVFVAIELRVAPVYVFALASLGLCIATAIFHAVSTLRSHLWDKTFMYAVWSTLLAYAACGFVGVSGWGAAGIMLGTAVLAAYLLAFVFPGAYVVKTGVFFVLTYFLTAVRLVPTGWQTAAKLLVASFVMFAIGLVCQVTDLERVFPIKRWGHGVWHLLTGVAIAILFYTVHLAQ